MQSTYQATASIQRNKRVCVIEDGACVETVPSFKSWFMLDALSSTPLLNREALSEESLVPVELQVQLLSEGRQRHEQVVMLVLGAPPAPSDPPGCFPNQLHLLLLQLRGHY